MKIDFIQLDTVSSTNTWAKENALKFNPTHLTCITAHEQTAGRGRQEKKWISPKNANLYTTFYFTIPKSAPYISNLGQMMALCCAELLLELCRGQKPLVQIKWPNDLLIYKKKVGGILTETIIKNNSMGVIVGVGLNINMPETILQTIDQPATSLHLVLQKNLNPSSLLQSLLKLFMAHLTQLQSEGFAPFQQRFFELLAYKGERITIKLPHKNIQGLCDSITPEGGLKLRLPSGAFLILSAGEILC
ncbi:MAG: biotin--[acetyl-CoA-carboxylase] ligase [Rhabdochlamydiaceae bacterium]